MQPIVFYADASWESPYVCSVYVALKEKNLPFEARPLDLHRGDQLQERFRALSLTARVPCIEHGDFVLSESLAIVEYLDEVAPGQALLPRQPRARARARQVMGWLRSDLLALREVRPTSTFFGPRASEALTPAALRDADKLIHAAAFFVLAWLLILWNGWPYRLTPQRLVLVAVLVVGYASLDEWLQTKVGRVGDVSDWLCDVVGGVAALVLACIMQEKRRSGRR